MANLLDAGADELTDWADALGEVFFLPADETMLQSMLRVSERITLQSFKPAAVNTFLQDADYYLVAFAFAHGHIVVTHERPSGGFSEIKIPTLFIGLGIKCMTPFEMLRKERARFILSPQEIVQ